MNSNNFEIDKAGKTSLFLAISFLFFSLKLWYNEVIMIKWGKEDALPEVY